MTPSITPPEAVVHALEVWLELHDRYAPGRVEGLYVVGSAVLGDWRPGSDIDIVAVGPTMSDVDVVDPLREAHRVTVEALDGVDVDGPRLTWDDLAVEPRPVLRPWTLSAEFHHDESCFELNPVMWHMIASHGWAARGLEPAELSVWADVVALKSFVQANADDYWRSVRVSVADALGDRTRTEFPAEMTSWCVLGLARLFYTVRTGSIASKTGAGRWLAVERPDVAELVGHAVAVRGQTSPPPDGREVVIATAAYMEVVISLITDDSGST